VRCAIGLLGQLASESQGRGDRCQRVLMLPSVELGDVARPGGTHSVISSNPFVGKFSRPVLELGDGRGRSGRASRC
jgi:hypothetical protein